MAEARKCDRCGGFYAPGEVGEAMMCHFKNPVLMDSTNYRQKTVGQRLLPDEALDYWVDLCPFCTTEFVIFMNQTKGSDSDEPG